MIHIPTYAVRSLRGRSGLVGRDLVNETQPLTPAGILGPEGRIAQKLPTYEHRAEQLQMAEAVAAGDRLRIASDRRSRHRRRQELRLSGAGHSGGRGA